MQPIHSLPKHAPEENPLSPGTEECIGEGEHQHPWQFSNAWPLLVGNIGGGRGMPLRTLPDFNVYYGSLNGKGHRATLKHQRKGIWIRAIIRKFRSPKIFSGDKLVLAFLGLKKLMGSSLWPDWDRKTRMKHNTLPLIRSGWMYPNCPSERGS